MIPGAVFTEPYDQVKYLSSIVFSTFIFPHVTFVPLLMGHDCRSLIGLPPRHGARVHSALMLPMNVCCKLSSIFMLFCSHVRDWGSCVDRWFCLVENTKVTNCEVSYVKDSLQSRKGVFDLEKHCHAVHPEFSLVLGQMSSC